MSHGISQMKPSAPIAMNAGRHPQLSAIHGTRIGVMIAPPFDPALNTPVASARSRDGNNSATVLIDDGKLPDSPRPSKKRATLNPPAVRASAIPIADKLHTVTDPAKPRRVPKRSMMRPANKNP